MAIETGNLLFRNPWLYEIIYPEAAADTAEACAKLFERYAREGSLKILDVGCGTGRVLARLAADDNQGVGIDISDPMIDYARRTHPDLRIEPGDMRSFDLGERFDAVICVGSTFTYNLANDQIHAALRNFRRHAEDGALLVLDIINASRFLSSEDFRERVETRVEEGNFRATSVSRHLLDRRRQSFRRVRTWKIDGEAEPIIDDAEYRLIFPLEMEDYLRQHEFELLGMWDNKLLADSDLTGRRLYVAARAV